MRGWSILPALWNSQHFPDISDSTSTVLPYLHNVINKGEAVAEEEDYNHTEKHHDQTDLPLLTSCHVGADRVGPLDLPVDLDVEEGKEAKRDEVHEDHVHPVNVHL